MNITKVICRIVMLAFVAVPARAQHHFTASEARTHVGETATVCGEVVSTRFAASTKGHPTFLNLDKPYPGQIFTIVVIASEPGAGPPVFSDAARYACVLVSSGAPNFDRSSPQMQLRVDSK